jgi:hypothetical protein
LPIFFNVVDVAIIQEKKRKRKSQIWLHSVYETVMKIRILLYS